MKRILGGLLAACGLLLGAAAVVYGGYDDSPGLQGLGVLLCGAIVAVLIRRTARRRRGSGGS